MMVFSRDMKLFKYNGVWIIGNKATGHFGGIDHKSKEFLDRLQENPDLEAELTPDNKQLLRFLLEEKLLIDNEEVPHINLEQVYLHVTNDCPLHCIGCYSADHTRNSHNDLSYPEICQTIQSLKAAGLKFLVISGGEPLLREDIVDIVKFAKNTAEIPYVVVLTSGVPLTKELASNLAKYVDEISISVDNYAPDAPTFIRDKGLFPKVDKAIQIAKESQFKNIRILPTIHKKNLLLLKKYQDYARKHRVGISYSLLTVPPTDVLQDWIPDSEQLAYLGDQVLFSGEELVLKSAASLLDVTDYHVAVCDKCGIGQMTISIGADGSIYPCHMAHRPELKLGHLKEEPLEQIVTRANNMYKKYKISHIENCKTCEHRNFCGGGCRARAYMYTETFYGQDPYCPMFKAFYSHFSESVGKWAE